MKFSSKIEKFLRKLAIREVKHEEGEFISYIFLLRKTPDSFRLILNLEKLKEFVLDVLFRMKTMDSVLNMITLVPQLLRGISTLLRMLQKHSLGSIPLKNLFLRIL